MRIISVSTLREFWEENPAASTPLRAWLQEARKATWASPQDIKTRYQSSSIINDEIIIFNIGGNNYRLVVKVWYAGSALYIKFIGSHRAYDDLYLTAL